MSFLDSIASVFSSVAAAAAGDARSSSGVSAYPSSGARIWPLSAVMREEMKKGVVYNMKVVLRGMRGTGKTTLLSRLSGHPMPSAYQPSTEISATTIRLCGRGCQPHEGTRVDIWDVVDEGRSRQPAESQRRAQGGELPLPSGKNQATLRRQLELLGTVADARTIDVYQGCHLAIFLIDPTRHDSLDYAVREAANVPFHTCVVFALNFCDMPRQKRMVSFADVEAACRTLRRATTPFVSELMQGRSPLNGYSVPAMAVSISAAFGTGIPRLVDMFNPPNTLIRLAAMEEKTRGLYASMERMCLSLADSASPLPGAITSGSGEDGAPPPPPHRRSARAEMSEQSASPGTASRGDGMAELSPPPSALAGGGLKLTNSAPKVATGASSGAAGPAAYDERGIQVGFFDDVVESVSSEETMESLSGSDEEEKEEARVRPTNRKERSARSPRRHGAPLVARPILPVKRKPDTAPTTAPDTQTTAVAERGTEAPFILSGGPDEGREQEESQTTQREPCTELVPAVPAEPVADVETQQQAAAEKAAAVEAVLLDAVRDSDGPGDDFFTSDAAATLAPMEDETVMDAPPGGGDSSAGASGGGELVARTLLTHRSTGRPASAAEKRRGDGRSVKGQPRPQVNVDVGALLAAMEATLEAKTPGLSEERDTDAKNQGAADDSLNEEKQGHSSHRHSKKGSSTANTR